MKTEGGTPLLQELARGIPIQVPSMPRRQALIEFLVEWIRKEEAKDTADLAVTPQTTMEAVVDGILRNHYGASPPSTRQSLSAWLTRHIQGGLRGKVMNWQFPLIITCWCMEAAEIFET